MLISDHFFTARSRLPRPQSLRFATIASAKASNVCGGGLHDTLQHVIHACELNTVGPPVSKQQPIKPHKFITMQRKTQGRDLPLAGLAPPFRHAVGRILVSTFCTLNFLAFVAWG